MTVALYTAVEILRANPQLTIVGLCGLVSYLVVQYYNSPWRKLPPGPRGLPIIGNILQMHEKQWLQFTEWRKTYGDLIYLNAAGQPVIVINSLKMAGDLLDRRATNYSERPRNIVAGEIITGGLFLTFQNHNDPIWRRMRRAGGEALNKGIAPKYGYLQATESLILTAGLLANPKSWDAQLRRTGASTTLTMVYGLAPTLNEHDPTVTAIGESANVQTTAAIQGAHWVEFFPWMNVAPWKRRAEERFSIDSALFKKLFGDVRRRLAKGQQNESFASTLIKDAERLGLSETENEWLSANVFAAGADAVAAAGDWWIFAMCLYPETQRRAQAEIDSVVGRSRIPTLADMESLPYVRAMAKEVLRWRPVDPVGIPHCAAEDDWYEGYFIPKGTVMIPNVWLMNRDPEIHGPDAEHFNPARHLDKDGKLTVVVPDTKEENQLSYGFGRRVCLGRYVANNHIFLQIAIILWALNIELPKDANGKPIPLDVDDCRLHGLAVRPVPIQPKFAPRFPDVIEMIEHELEARHIKVEEARAV
ncbi:hypothetical protein NLJ89_g2380 [Agrocybe chaxingu]|uniref:Cytochrome P450 n=1 Tax=Agrocybe chaxingu TaxID=84603 RepID=A0A9W8K604_9AGAR|nr:hypothetical protein NLJ89_g2380 [Agrocybe chaxingu]